MNRSCNSILHVYKLNQRTLQKSSFDKLLRSIYLSILWKGSQRFTAEPVKFGSTEPKRSESSVSPAFHLPVCPEPEAGGRSWLVLSGAFYNAVSYVSIPLNGKRGANTGWNVWVEKLYSGTMITHICPRLLHNITVFIERLFGWNTFQPATGLLSPKAVLHSTPLRAGCRV